MHPLSKPKGMALLPVLFIIALITIVVVMFFSLSTVQYQSSTSQAAANDVGSLRDTAINMAIGQLRQGTTQTNSLWISQPGAIRTYQAASGVPSRIYKLYSAGEMSVAAEGLPATQQNLESDVPLTWNDMPQVYANLNDPAIRPNGELAFPIIDPRAMETLNAETSDYPDRKTPEGFSYSKNLAVSGSGINGVLLPGSAPENQRLPMPVRWIYVLANGTYGVLDPASKNFVPFQNQNTSSTPSAENPIVGRIAFWTDDETSKVNLNTASEGIHWDTPRAATPEDVAYASQPPARNEVQRFGGHPASTSLSSVFFPGKRLDPANSADRSMLMQIYDMAPRVNYRDAANQFSGYLGGNLKPIAYDTDRLYASVDEFLFQAPDASSSTLRSAQPLLQDDPNRLARLRFFLTAESRAPETTAMGTPRISLWPTSADPDRTSNRYTSFDRLAVFASTLGGKTYGYRRYTNPTSALTEYGSNNSTAAQAWLDILKGNAYISSYLLALSEQKNQGYSKSLEEKYGQQNVAAGIVSMLEYIRQTNIHDTTTSVTGQQVVPYDMGAWGKDTYGPSEAHGQIINVADTALPSPLVNRLKADPNLRLNALNRIYTTSEIGLVLSLAAEHKMDGTKVNSSLVDQLKIPKGFKAVQIGVVFEGFCPSQGYAMIAPAVGTYVNLLNSIRMDTSKSNSRAPGGDVTSSADPNNPVQSSGNATLANAWLQWGRWNHNVPSLCYLTGTNMPGKADRISKGAKWWVGWGGSGGRFMYVDPPNKSIIGTTSGYATNVNNVGVNNFYQPQFGETVTNATHSSQYSRGYFLVPSEDTHVTIKSSSVLQLHHGYVNHGPAHSRIIHRFTIPANMKVPVPHQPLGHAFTWRERIINASANRARSPDVIDPNDVVRTWTVRHGDYRLISLREAEINDNLNPNHRLFIPHPDWNPAELSGSTLAASQNKLQIHSFTKAGGEWEKQQHLPITGTSVNQPVDARPSRGLAKDVSYSLMNQPDFPRNPSSPEFFPAKPGSYPYSVDPSDTRDWDNGTGISPDGAYWNKPDDVAKIWDGNVPPYFSKNPWDGVREEQLNETVAPNQLIPSAVMFGSISSGVHTGLPWTTYLFRPNVSKNTAHVGEKNNSITGNMNGAPADHTILDWFWMPVLQPYAISEPFSTAGKINMNYRIAPFTYIKRATALHAAMKSERFLAIPTSAGQTYKDYNKRNSNTGWRHYIDVDKTLVQWEDRFNDGQFFKNASEICEQFLVPEDEDITATNISTLRDKMQEFWDDHRLTGDNTLERPYANLYPRLTTRSNTFRVHFLVQSLRKARTSNPLTFDPETDLVIGESQGDALIERAIDPNDPELSSADYDYLGKAQDGNLTSAKSLDHLYTWRVRHVRNFSR